MSVSEELASIYARRGSAAYFGEAVSMTEHGLQAAYFAQAAAAPDALVIAALLHDIGHLIESVPDDLADWTSDAQHELSGSRWLAARFGAGRRTACARRGSGLKTSCAPSRTACFCSTRI